MIEPTVEHHQTVADMLSGPQSAAPSVLVLPMVALLAGRDPDAHYTFRQSVDSEGIKARWTILAITGNAMLRAIGTRDESNGQSACETVELLPIPDEVKIQVRRVRAVGTQASAPQFEAWWTVTLGDSVYELPTADDSNWEHRHTATQFVATLARRMATGA